MATGCVKILRKALDFNHDGKYIPEHKRGPDIDLFRNQSIMNHEQINIEQIAKASSAFFLALYVFFPEMILS